jgi:hypothetical protein
MPTATAIAPAPAFLERLTRLQREDLTRLLNEGDVVAYGLVGGSCLEVLVQVEVPGTLGPHDEPWRVVQRFWHGFRDTHSVGLAQAEIAVARLQEGGGAQVMALPAKPDGWWGWR